MLSLSPFEDLVSELAAQAPAGERVSRLEEYVAEYGAKNDGLMSEVRRAGVTAPSRFRP